MPNSTQPERMPKRLTDAEIQNLYNHGKKHIAHGTELGPAYMALVQVMDAMQPSADAAPVAQPSDEAVARDAGVYLDIVDEWAEQWPSVKFNWLDSGARQALANGLYENQILIEELFSALSNLSIAEVRGITAEDRQQTRKAISLYHSLNRQSAPQPAPSAWREDAKTRLHVLREVKRGFEVSEISSLAKYMDRLVEQAEAACQEGK